MGLDMTPPFNISKTKATSGMTQYPPRSSAEAKQSSSSSLQTDNRAKELEALFRLLYGQFKLSGRQDLWMQLSAQISEGQTESCQITCEDEESIELGESDNDDASDQFVDPLPLFTAGIALWQAQSGSQSMALTTSTQNVGDFSDILDAEQLETVDSCVKQCQKLQLKIDETNMLEAQRGFVTAKVYLQMHLTRQRLQDLIKSESLDGKLTKAKVYKTSKQLLQRKWQDLDQFEAWYTDFKNQANRGKYIELVVDLFGQECLNPSVPWRVFYQASKTKKLKYIEFLYTKPMTMRE